MTDWYLLWDLYWLNILAVSLAGVCLAQIGCHLSGRDQSLQVFCLSQASITGVMITLIGIFILIGHHDLDHILSEQGLLPVGGGFFAAYLAGFMLDVLAKSRNAGKSTLFIAIFCVLLSLNSLLSRAFPNLDQHFTRVFFGDVTTINATQSYMLITFSIITIVWYVNTWRSYARETFEHAFFGQIQDGRSSVKRNIFDLWILLLLVLVIQTLGFVGTLVFLFLPSVMMKLLALKRLKSHLLASGLFAFLAIPFGFGISLLLPQFPTISVIVLFMICLSLLAVIVFRFRSS